MKTECKFQVGDRYTINFVLSLTGIERKVLKYFDTGSIKILTKCPQDFF